VAFGYSRNVAETLTTLLKPRKIERWSLFRRPRRRYATGQLEYRTWGLATLADAKAAVDQIVLQRDAAWRRFSPSVRQ
jgi:hypothetical protein